MLNFGIHVPEYIVPGYKRNCHCHPGILTTVTDYHHLVKGD